MAVEYRSQAARDAQAMNYGNESYWLHLEQHAFELRGRFLAEQNWSMADEMLNRSLSEALRGNDGD